MQSQGRPGNGVVLARERPPSFLAEEGGSPRFLTTYPPGLTRAGPARQNGAAVSAGTLTTAHTGSGPRPADWLSRACVCPRGGRAKSVGRGPRRFGRTELSDTRLTIPEPAKVGLTEIRSLVLPSIEKDRQQIAIRSDLAAADELRRRIEAFRKYIQDRQGRDLLAAEARRTEVLIGKLLGPAKHGGDRRSEDFKLPAGNLKNVPKLHAHKFRLMGANEGLVEAQLRSGIVARNAILRLIQPSGNGKPRRAGGPPKVLQSLAPLLEAGETFGTIYADPPWAYGNQGTRAATRNHYQTMTVEQIAAMPMARLAADRAHLWLWTTNGFLFECPRIFAAWGFEFKASYVWVKPQMGIGNYLRNAHELLLLAVRGGLTGAAKDVMSWGRFERAGHSAKPEAIRRKVVERISPGPRLELFGRSPVDGWTVLGNQIELGLYDHDVIEA